MSIQKFGTTQKQTYSKVEGQLTLAPTSMDLGAYAPVNHLDFDLTVSSKNLGAKNVY